MLNKLLNLLIIFIVFIVIYSLYTTAALKTTSVSAQTPLDNYNCSDFTTQSQAQTMFDSVDQDIYQLDKDHDGVACESLSR